MRPVFGLLGEGRGAFLEFLRNLTPQILLLSCAAFTGASLDLGKWDLSNLASTLLVVLCLALFAVSALANGLQFTEGYLVATNPDLLERADRVTRYIEYPRRRKAYFRLIIQRFGLRLAATVLVTTLVVQTGFAIMVWHITNQILKVS